MDHDDGTLTDLRLIEEIEKGSNDRRPGVWILGWNTGQCSHVSVMERTAGNCSAGRNGGSVNRMEEGQPVQMRCWAAWDARTERRAICG